MMPGLPVTTPPATSDEASFSLGSPSAGSPSWSPARARGTPRLKGKQARRKQNRKELSDSGFKLEGPISVLTERFHSTPIRDMDAWVSRSAFVRLEEVRNRNGKISRPMNSFMLYRSAYAERTKKLVGANNHQIVSKIAGLGWKMEPSEIRRKYEELAKVERDNHAATHPNYKFSPNKNMPANRRDSGSPSAMPAHVMEDGEFSDLDSEFGGSNIAGARPYGSHSRSHSFEDPCYDTSRDSSPFGGPDSMMLPCYTHSPWTNTSHPAGMPVMHPSALQGTGSQVEDLRFRTAGSNHQDITYDSPLAGLPGAAHHELLQQPTQSLSTNDMDPRLLSQGSEVPTMASSYPSPYPVWTDEASQGYYPATSAPSMSPSPAPYSQPGMASAYLPSMQMEGREALWDMPRPGEGMAEPTAAEFEMWCTSGDQAHY
jgi:hypothetical protein